MLWRRELPISSLLRHDCLLVNETTECGVRKGAIILCGGRSTRMGRSKPMLPFGHELMLQRVVRLVGQAVDEPLIVVVAAEGQELPDLPNDVRVCRDTLPERGPLEGLAAGLASLQHDAAVAYATSCDVPLLVTQFVTRMFDLLGESEAAVSCEGVHCHPLAAVYRVSVLEKVRALLYADQRRVADIFDRVVTRRINVNELRDVDPELRSLMNINYPEDYLRACKAAGVSLPNET